MEALAGLDGRNYHLGRTEQHRVDGVEIALEALEDLRKGLAVIAGALARQSLRELARLARRTGDEIRMRRRKRRGTESLHDSLQRKSQLVRFVQRDLEYARHHLHAAGKAL